MCGARNWTETRALSVVTNLIIYEMNELNIKDKSLA